MNVKELMIGNWVKHAGGDYMQVTKLTENHYACSKNGGCQCWDYNNIYNPVLLTVEILENNGFKQENMYVDDCYEYTVFCLNDFYIIQNYIEFEPFTICKLYNSTYNGNIGIGIKGIHYVHELQNFLQNMEIDKKITL